LAFSPETVILWPAPGRRSWSVRRRACRPGRVWGIGSTLPRTRSDFGRNAQYGALLSLTYTAGAGTVQRFNDFRNVLPTDPCAADH